MGKLIIIEGTDASGKQTQTELLYKNLKEMGYKVFKVSFPDYNSDACMPVKMFLAGEFGSLSDVSYYASSSFFAIDRYASFKKKWEKLYNEGYIILSDRYTISNIIHQANKITDSKEFDDYCEWLLDFEWNKFKLPKPDITIFLNVPYNISNKLMENRVNKITKDLKKDILESDENQKLRAYNVANKISEKYKFDVVNCSENNILRSVDSIQKELLDIVLKKINN